MKQQTPEWHQARLGCVTASRISDVVARTKTGWGASRANYLAELVAERLTGKPAEQYTNAAMAWGTEHEPQARAAYAFSRDVDIEEVGFVLHPTIAMSGASPDGLVGCDGLIEIKCPATSTMIETLLTRVIPDKYIVQMQWQMVCTDRQWCDYVSYDPRLPERMSLFIRRVMRDDKRIKQLENDVIDFLEELYVTIDNLEKLYGNVDPIADLMEKLRQSAGAT